MRMNVLHVFILLMCFGSLCPKLIYLSIQKQKRFCGYAPDANTDKIERQIYS